MVILAQKAVDSRQESVKSVTMGTKRSICVLGYTAFAWRSQDTSLGEEKSKRGKSQGGCPR